MIESGPLLNPAIAFGMLLFHFNFSLSTLQYLLCPFAGSVLALIFYEHIYVKTQELIEDTPSSDGMSDDNRMGGLGDLEGEIEPGQTSADGNN